MHLVAVRHRLGSCRLNRQLWGPLPRKRSALSQISRGPVVPLCRCLIPPRLGGFRSGQGLLPIFFHSCAGLGGGWRDDYAVHKSQPAVHPSIYLSPGKHFAAALQAACCAGQLTNTWYRFRTASHLALPQPTAGTQTSGKPQCGSLLECRLRGLLALCSPACLVGQLPHITHILSGPVHYHFGQWCSCGKLVS